MKSLVEKLAEVMGAVGWIEKSGYNEFHKYSYAQEATIVNAIRGELAKRSVMIFPNVKEVKRTEHTVETFKGIRKTQLTEITVDWTFCDGESGQERTITAHGVGEDNVDKGYYKALTGCEKYVLMKTFLLPTGDDPERDSKEDAQEAKEQGKATAKQVGEEKAAKLRQKAPEASPDQLCVIQLGDEYEITGEPAVMNNHKELLLGLGRRVGKAVVMNADGLNAFQYQFVTVRGGTLTNLKPVEK